jgi:hypothetical protein
LVGATVLREDEIHVLHVLGDCTAVDAELTDSADLGAGEVVSASVAEDFQGFCVGDFLAVGGVGVHVLASSF